MTSKSFYHEFEANFRGSRAEIMQRLEAYRPFFTPLLAAERRPKVIDVGCGRGEWLELVTSAGMDAHGVDLDDGMLQDCFDRGLSAEKADAVAYLKNLPDNSQAIVSGFHIAEHLPFEVLQDLISEALRVLQPGGLLILETPNAENINVGTLSFHMDPTHVKPLPPGLLSFLPRFHGFYRSRVIRLQESKRLMAAEKVRLLEVFQGVSPDYAVVAQKNADPALLEQFDSIFSADFGLTLDTLSERFENQFAPVEVERRVTANDARIADLERRLDEIARQNSEYQQKIIDFYNSTSWRVTSPLRAFISGARSGRVVMKRLGKDLLRNAIRTAWSIGPVRSLGRKVALRYPRLAYRLRRLFISASGAMHSGRGLAQNMSEAQLSTKAQDFYKRLQGRLER